MKNIQPTYATLEESAENDFNDFKRENPIVLQKHILPYKLGYIQGAKWQAERMGLMEIELRHTKTLLTSCEKALEDRDKQAERMYSEEEVLELIWKYETRKTSMVGYGNVKKWFEQFKKK
jgi:hypothetical protein